MRPLTHLKLTFYRRVQRNHRAQGAVCTRHFPSQPWPCRDALHAADRIRVLERRVEA